MAVKRREFKEIFRRIGSPQMAPIDADTGVEEHARPGRSRVRPAPGHGAFDRQPGLIFQCAQIFREGANNGIRVGTPLRK